MHLRIFAFLVAILKKEMPNNRVYQKILNQLVQAILRQYRIDKNISVLVVCKDNVASSFLGSALGNAVSAFHNLDSIKFYSGGFLPGKLNKEAILVLEEIGFEILESGECAYSAENHENNCVFVYWGKKESDGSLEYSKLYNDLKIPSKCHIVLLFSQEKELFGDVFQGSQEVIELPFSNLVLSLNPFTAKSQLIETRNHFGAFLCTCLGMVRDELDKALK